MNFSFNEEEKNTNEFILDTTMDVEVKEVTTFGSHNTVVPEETGQEWFCGKMKCGLLQMIR
jgi:hypothetical protein